jgi:hypothetical protein
MNLSKATQPNSIILEDISIFLDIFAARCKCSHIKSGAKHCLTPGKRSAGDDGDERYDRFLQFPAAAFRDCIDRIRRTRIEDLKPLEPAPDHRFAAGLDLKNHSRTP